MFLCNPIWGHRRFFPLIFRGALDECTVESSKFLSLLQLITLKPLTIGLKRCTTFVGTVHTVLGVLKKKLLCMG